MTIMPEADLGLSVKISDFSSADFDSAAFASPLTETSAGAIIPVIDLPVRIVYFVCSVTGSGTVI